VAAASDDTDLADSLAFLAPAGTPIPPSNSPVALFAAREMCTVAERAVAASNGALVHREISWGRFDTADGWPQLFIPDAHNLPMTDVMFLASLHSPDVVFEQLSALYALARYGSRSMRVIVPFFPTGTMERVDRQGEVATAATLARLLSVIPHCAGGPVQLVFFDIHALQEQFYFTDNIIVQLKSCTRLLRDRLAQLDGDCVVIVFPDDGAYKRFHSKFPAYNTVVCHKIRDGDERIVDIRDGLEFVNGAHCVIVDDLVKSGGTLIECAVVLQNAGALKLSCYVTHGVFPNESFLKFAHAHAPKVRFEHFWITDSIPTVAAKVESLPPFQVLSMAPLLTYLRPHFLDDMPERFE